ncbi:transglycosylase SLT domain-containing protein [Thioalkalivibrio nitratireducens]|nr:transglycosylase SLT domain-containing protein [Thioalkalivibrio nitratireducens]
MIRLIGVAALFLAVGWGLGFTAVVTPAKEEPIDGAYRVVDTVAARYQTGVDEIRTGQPAAGRDNIERAIADLAAAGAVCAETSGCEVQRFMAAYHNLLTLRSDVLAGAAEEYVELQPELDAETPQAVLQPDVADTTAPFDGRDLIELIDLNSLVRAALHDWLTWMRPSLIDAYEHYLYLRPLMWPTYEAAGLPEALLFGILAKESGGRVHSVSRAGAAGPLQFMAHTGRRFGLGHDDGFDTRFDPTAATRANVAYLREQFAQLDDDLALALAAYNGGEGRIRRLVAGSDDPSFWNPAIFGQLPRETQEYVPYVLAAAWLFLHPNEYGLEFPRADTAHTRFELQHPKTLGELAICLGQDGTRAGWFRTLRNLNPRFEHDQRLPAGTRLAAPAALVGAYRRHCVAGPRRDLAQNLHDSRDERRDLLATRIYTVRSGDTLSTIASEQGCPSTRGIAHTNGIAGPRYLIRPGQKLELIGCGS